MSPEREPKSILVCIQLNRNHGNRVLQYTILAGQCYTSLVFWIGKTLTSAHTDSFCMEGISKFQGHGKHLGKTTAMQKYAPQTACGLEVLTMQFFFSFFPQLLGPVGTAKKYLIGLLMWVILPAKSLSSLDTAWHFNRQDTKDTDRNTPRFLITRALN